MVQASVSPAQMVNNILGAEECLSVDWELLPPEKGQPRIYVVRGQFRGVGAMRGNMSADGFTGEKAAKMLALYAKDLMRKATRRALNTAAG